MARQVRGFAGRLVDQATTRDPILLEALRYGEANEMMGIADGTYRVDSTAAATSPSPVPPMPFACCSRVAPMSTYGTRDWTLAQPLAELRIYTAGDSGEATVRTCACVGNASSRCRREVLPVHAGGERGDFSSRTSISSGVLVYSQNVRTRELASRRLAKSPSLVFRRRDSERTVGGQHGATSPTPVSTGLACCLG